MLAGEDAAFAARHVVPAGREQQILALFLPYTLGGEVSPGFRLWTVSIEKKHIRVGVSDKSSDECGFVLRHPSDDAESDDVNVSQHFVARRERSSKQGVDCEKAGFNAPIDLLVQSIRSHEAYSPWQEVYSGTSVPKTTEPNAWGPIDGIAAYAFMVLLAALLSWRLLRKAPKHYYLALAGILVFGLLVRFKYSPVAFLAPSPWARIVPNVRAVMDGPILHAVALHEGHGFWLTDVISWTNLAYAVATPLVFFAHASYLVRDIRVGLFAAFLLAALPQHIRYSQCEDAFVPSMLISSLSFALLHAWLRDRSTAVRCIAMCTLPVTLYMGYLIRPLNPIFFVLYTVAIFYLHTSTTTSTRRWTAFAILAGVAILAIPTWLTLHSSAAAKSLPMVRWIPDVASAFLIPRLFVLTDPYATPMVLMLLAVIGVRMTWRTEHRKVMLFLLLWVTIFTVAHAVVLEPAMRPRYHLHIVPPFLFFAAMALASIEKWSKNTRTALLVVVAMSPIVHREFIADVSFTDVQEHAFVLRAREIIPKGCSVVETSSEDHGLAVRFARIGHVVGGEFTSPIKSIVFLPDGSLLNAPTKSTINDVVSNPPDCLYLYEGLECWRGRGPTEAYSSLCTELSQRLQTIPVMTETSPYKLYDSQRTPPRMMPGDPIMFRLSRAQRHP